MSQPAHRIRIGNVTATIWRNLGERGGWYSVNLARSFKVDDGWRNTQNLGHDDLLTAAKALNEAHSWIVDRLAADRQLARKSA
jgi:hypothetical protein